MHTLPQLLAEMADAVGIQPVLALVEWRGGIPFYVPLPQNLTVGHELTCKIGRAAADWLCRNYGGGYVKIPRAAAYIRSLRDIEIQRLHAEGTSANQLALKYGLDARSMWRILGASAQSAERSAEQQIRLF